MNAHAMESRSEFRALTDLEIDHVSGGLFWVGWAVGFLGGIAVGAIIARW